MLLRVKKFACIFCGIFFLSDHSYALAINQDYFRQDPSYAPPQEYSNQQPDYNPTYCSGEEYDLEQVLEQVKNKDENAIKTLIDCLKLNRKLIFRAALIDASQFQYAADLLREDEDFVKRLIKVNPEVIKYASEKLCQDPLFMEQATYLSRDSLQYANPKLLDNKLFMTKMITIDSRNYIFASERIKEISEIAKMAFHDNGLLLSFAPAKIKSDKSLVEIAVKSNSAALENAGNNLKKDKKLQALAKNKSSVKSKEVLEKFLEENYVESINKKNLGFTISNRMKFFAENKIIDRNYITKWQKNYKVSDASPVHDVRLIAVDNRNYPVSWKEDFKKYPDLIKKIEKFFTNHNVDQNTIDNLSTTYLWKQNSKNKTLILNLYLLRESKDIELGPEFANVTSLTAIMQKVKGQWRTTVVEVIFDSEIKVDIAYPNGHKKFILWDLHKVDNNDKTPKIIFKVEDRFKEYFEVYEEQNGGKYQMIYRIMPTVL